MGVACLIFASGNQLAISNSEDLAATAEKHIVVEYFNNENCQLILASGIFGTNPDDSKTKCENILRQNGAYVNYWVKSVRINGACSNVQAYDTLANSCLRFQ